MSAQDTDTIDNLVRGINIHRSNLTLESLEELTGRLGVPDDCVSSYKLGSLHKARAEHELFSRRQQRLHADFERWFYGCMVFESRKIMNVVVDYYRAKGGKPIWIADRKRMRRRVRRWKMRVRRRRHVNVVRNHIMSAKRQIGNAKFPLDIV